MKLFVYKFVRTLGLPIYKFLYRPIIIGKENIPLKGGAILVGNHTHKLNAATIIATPVRNVHTLAKKELYKNKFSSWFFNSMGCIKVDRDSHKDNVKDEVGEALNNNEVIGIFPEGTINRTKELILPFKYGAVRFAKEANVPIIPFVIVGDYKPFKKGLVIEYGEPIYIKGEIEEENNRLMEIIKNMIVNRRENEKK